MFSLRLKPRLKPNHQNRNVIKGGFYESIRMMLLAIRLTGLLPISGLMNNSSELTSIQWKSLYTLLYCIPSLILQALGLIVAFYDFIHSDYEFRKLGGLIFYLINFVATLFFLLFCRKWKAVQKEIESTEKLLPTTSSHKSTIVGNWLMASLLFLGFMEHVLYLLFTIKIAVNCFALPDDSGLYIKSYFILMHKTMYEFCHIHFSYIFGFLVQFSKSQVTLQWSITDAFILVISCYLLNLFKNFNRLIELKGQNFFSKTSKPSWAELQVHYTLISRLVTIIDQAINFLVFISFTGNLILTGQQLFFYLNKLTRHYIVNRMDCLSELNNGWESYVYVTYSFLFVIGKLMLVSFLAAEVHTMSRKPLYALYAVPSSGYDKDLNRLMKQVFHSRVCLSGLHFFYITRSMILVMVGMLMTYELVLLQF